MEQDVLWMDPTRRTRMTYIGYRPIMAIGQPIGRFEHKVGAANYLHWNHRLTPLKRAEYAVWMAVARGESVDYFLDHTQRSSSVELHTHTSAESVVDQIESLITQQVCMDATTPEPLDRLVPLRQGVGLGYLRESKLYAIQIGRVTLTVTPRQFMYWLKADGKTSWSAIIGQLTKEFGTGLGLQAQPWEHRLSEIQGLLNLKLLWMVGSEDEL